ncbi:FxSxx-COOH protein [Streptomyces sp. NBC_01537]|uniref:FxSxx-COOH cyclophane-containing RiPP peptide n=1 Tax=Streptomyces sp. NBC_01537 TaxID=2903896 RepID=UPI0038685AC9
MTNEQHVGSDTRTAPAMCAGRLPDLTGVDLEALRTLDHPVLSEVIEHLVQRALDPEGVFAEHNTSMP